MNHSVEVLRSKYKKFIFEDYVIKYKDEKLTFTFTYKIEPDIIFSPSLEFHGIKQETYLKMSKQVLENIAFHLGLAEIPSYWKATCSPEIVIKAGKLDKYQTEWWKSLIINGMGEFFFTNQINFTSPDFINIVSSGSDICSNSIIPSASDDKRLLIPIGGGKDSIVTLNILGKHKDKYQIGCFVLNPIPAALNVIKNSNCDEIIMISRRIDPNLIKLNSEGFLNGHTPFSAVLAFLSVAISTIYNYNYVVLSNERSSNEGNTLYLGRSINHQYSKSFEFENLFREYISIYLHNSLNFFSFLRPLYEIQIARYFSELKKYHSIFLSCNRRQKENKWCGTCPKCLSTFLLLYPFLGTSEITKIFSKDLFQDSDLTHLALQLASKKSNKPFECVGTYEESLIAFYLSIINQPIDKDLPELLKIVKEEILEKEIVDEQRIKSLLYAWSNENNLPQEFSNYLRDAIGFGSIA